LPRWHRRGRFRSPVGGDDRAEDPVPDQRLPTFPPGTVRALLATDHVSARTRSVLRERLSAPAASAPRFFDPAAFATLRAVCARLVPQPDRADPIDLAGAIDRRLADGSGNGWRYDDLPPDGDAYRLGLAGLDEAAAARHGGPFVAIGPAAQDAILGAVQRGEVAGGAWERVPPRRFFEEVLADAAEVYYAHPLAQEEIGYVGMADLPGWTEVGLDRLEAREPRPLSVPGGRG
jgi:hypothetical protein